MNIAVIFAGGVGTRMNTKAKPKQFLELHGKAIIIHTLEYFENHPEIDGIIISCVEPWIKYLKRLIKKFNFTKVDAVVAGGVSGQMSIYNGLTKAEELYPDDSIVLIHDGVRPLINEQVISDNIAQVKKTGTAITTAPTVETFVVVDEDMSVKEVPKRAASKLAKAPQSFRLSHILKYHREAQKNGQFNAIDSCTLMYDYNQTVTLVEGPVENIKITTPTDFFVFKAIHEARKNKQILEL